MEVREFQKPPEMVLDVNLVRKFLKNPKEMGPGRERIPKNDQKWSLKVNCGEKLLKTLKKDLLEVGKSLNLPQNRSWK